MAWLFIASSTPKGPLHVSCGGSGRSGGFQMLGCKGGTDVGPGYWEEGRDRCPASREVGVDGKVG